LLSVNTSDRIGDAAALYVGETLHARLVPFAHRFRYRIAAMLIDIDRLSEADCQSRIFSINRFNLFGFYERDHGARDGSSLREWAEARFLEAGISLGSGAIRLMAFPRLLGYVFNPISVWFGYDDEGVLRGMIYEVNNTFGDSHAYVMATSDACAPHEAEKRLHVSPFFSREGRYRFRVHAPDATYRLSILYDRNGQKALSAIQRGERQPLNTKTLLGVFVRFPLMTLKVICAIHFEALRLMIKGARYHRRPEPQEPASLAKSIPTRPEEVNA
jgi:uncharacterized protein